MGESLTIIATTNYQPEFKSWTYLEPFKNDFSSWGTKVFFTTIILQSFGVQTIIGRWQSVWFFSSYIEPLMEGIENLG
jgi:hypothetical protein